MEPQASKIGPGEDSHHPHVARSKESAPPKALGKQELTQGRRTLQEQNTDRTEPKNEINRALVGLFPPSPHSTLQCCKTPYTHPLSTMSRPSSIAGLIDKNSFAAIAPASPASPTVTRGTADDKGTPTPAQRSPRAMDPASKQARIDALTAQINEVRNAEVAPRSPSPFVGVAGSQHAPKRTTADLPPVADVFKPTLRDGLEPGTSDRT